MHSAVRPRAFFLSFLFLATAGGWLRADDRFSLTVGQHGDLLIFGPKGEKVADLPVPSISQAVTVNGSTSFQVSYGRDVNDRLTAILAPNAAQPVDLHFSCLGKNIDATNEAVVTLTFSRSLGSVSVDPGYIGVVQVNSGKIRHHDLADDSAIPAVPPPEMPYHPMHTMAPATDNEAPPREEPTTASSTTPSPFPDASMASANPSYTPAPPASGHLFWAEPVTGPNGHAPYVAVNQMKLVEVQGSISVHPPGAQVEDGSDGQIIPSGSIVSTGDGSSAAIFIGGVDSIRLLPDSEVMVTHHLEGSTRHTIVDLRRGTAFSRVGHRNGETQQYEVRGLGGTALARGTELANSLQNGHFYTFVEKGTVGLFAAGQFLQDVTGNGGSSIGIGAYPPAGDGSQILTAILTELQPFNTKTNLVALHVEQGSATKAELAYYTAAIYGALLEEGLPPGGKTYLAAEVGAAVTVALHDLLPFVTPETTPH
jgi:hypothetical protein